MSTNKNTSVLIDSLLPDYLETEGPKFQQFIRAYYEWLETTNQITDRAKNLDNYQDIDRTLDEFVEYFRREILDTFPKDVLADKANLYKNIKDLYYAKGTENAYKLLFRILFNEEIELYYPGDDILRVSDGRWVQENTIRLSSPFVGNPEAFGGKNIVGQTSGATAKVNRVVSTTEAGVPVFELFLININGTFLDTEVVTSTDESVSGVIISSIGPLQGVILTFGGANHRKGDIVTLTSSSGSGANGAITRTNDTSLQFDIIDGGSGYVVNNVVSLIGGNGTGAAARVSAIANTEILPVYTDTISPFANVPLNTGPTFVSTGANTAAVSANLASSNVSSTIGTALGTSNVTVGTISELAVTRGSNYTEVPTATVTNEDIANQVLDDGQGGLKGLNAVIVANTIAGSITDIEVDNQGTLYNRSDIITISNTTRANTENALGAAQVTGVINYPGSYKDTKGFLSWNNRLQDNYFYQEFSYVVRSSKAFELYKELSNKLTHPAGMKQFAEVRFTANLDFTASVIIEPIIKTHGTIVTDIFIPTVVSANTSVYEETGPEGGIYPVPEIEVPLDVNIADVSNYDLLTGNNFELEVELQAITPQNTVDINVVSAIEDVTINVTAYLPDLTIDEIDDATYIVDGEIVSPASNIAINSTASVLLHVVSDPAILRTYAIPSIESTFTIDRSASANLATLTINNVIQSNYVVDGVVVSPSSDIAINSTATTDDISLHTVEFGVPAVDIINPITSTVIVPTPTINIEIDGFTTLDQIPIDAFSNNLISTVNALYPTLDSVISVFNITEFSSNTEVSNV